MTRHSSASRLNVVSAIIAGLLLAGGSPASAAVITFDFEALSTQQGPTILSTVGGLTLTVTRQDAASVAIQDLNGTPTVPDFGHRTLSNFLGGSNASVSASTLLLSFSAPVSSASISFGDLGGFATDDDDTPVVLTAFAAPNGTGAALGSSAAAYPITLGFALPGQGNSAIRTVGVTAGGIRSLTISSGGPFPGTLYYDNIVVDTAPVVVPEPASVLLLGGGLAGVLARRRTRHL